MTHTKSNIQLSKPAELVSIVPYLLGFHPEQSLVVVGMSGSEVRCTIRLDLPLTKPTGSSLHTTSSGSARDTEGTAPRNQPSRPCSGHTRPSEGSVPTAGPASESLNRLVRGRLGCPAISQAPTLDLSKEFEPRTPPGEQKAPPEPPDSTHRQKSTNATPSASPEPGRSYPVADATFPASSHPEPSLVSVAGNRAELAPFLMRNDCDRCVLVGYGPPEDVTDALTTATENLVKSGLNILDRLRVNKGRWWSQGCQQETCCPTEGSAIPESTAATLSFVALGGTALPSRKDVVAQLMPVDDATLAQVRSATATTLMNTIDSDYDWADVIASDLTALDHWMKNSQLPPVDDLAELALGLSDPQVREMALEFINRDPLNGRLDLWIWITRHLDDEFIAPAAAITGFCAYRQGNGVLAAVALERSLRADPRFRFAQILLKLLNSGVPPATLGRLVNNSP